MESEWTEAYAGKDAELSAVLAEYLLAVDRGEVPERGAFLAAHPDLADRLRTFFLDQDQMDSLTAPLRPEPAAPPAIGAYDLTEEIGRGGMGMVWRGRDRILNRDLAVKILLDRYRDRPDLVRRFVEEAQITGQLQHPYIVPVHELGILPDGRPFFAMKLVNGRTLADLLDDRPNPGHELERFLHIFEQVCQTIAYAHSKGVIHRDLKPANVMVGTFGEVQVMDWGLAKVLGDKTTGYHTPVEPSAELPMETIRGDNDDSNTRTGEVLGTLAFMPPEQAAGNVEGVDRRSDVFGLGAILCNVLTGRPPYVGEPAEVRAQVRAGATAAALARLDACGADSELIGLAKSCLAADPGNRPNDAATVVEALATYFTAVRERLRRAEIARAQAETEAVQQRKQAVLAEAKAVAEERRARAEARRRRATVAMAVLLLMLIATAAGFGLWIQDQHARRDAERAARRADTERDVTAALREVKLLQDEGVRQADDPDVWGQTLTIARAAFKRAQEALNLGEPSDDLRGQVAAVGTTLARDDRDCQILAEFDRILEDYWVGGGQGADLLSTVRRYEKVFRDNDLPILEQPASEMARTLINRRFGPQFREAVEIWAKCLAVIADDQKPEVHLKSTYFAFVPTRYDWGKSEGLLKLLNATESGPQAFRCRWRDARSRNDRAALLKLTDSLDTANMPARAILNLADDLEMAGEIEAAIRLLRTAMDREQNKFLLYTALGLAYYNNNSSSDQAVHHLSAATALRSHSPFIHVQLSSALDKRGDVEGSLRHARRAVELDARSFRAQMRLGNVQRQRGAWTEAAQSHQKAVALDPASSVAHDALGFALVFSNQEGGFDHLRQAVLLAPKHFAHQYNLGICLNQVGETAKAIASYREALRDWPDMVAARINLAQALAQANDIPEAMKVLEEGVSRTPKNPELYYVMAELHAKKGEMQTALNLVLKKGVEQDPRSADNLATASNFMMEMGAGSPLALARKAFELDASRPWTHYVLVRALIVAREHKEAVVRAEEALRRFPQEPSIHDVLGCALHEQGRPDRALARHRDASQLNPSVSSYHENAGLALRAMGDFAGAESAFRQAIGLNKFGARAYYLLGETLLYLRRYDEAIAAAEKSIECSRYNNDAYGMLIHVQVQKGDFLGAMQTTRQWHATLPPSSPWIKNAKPHLDRIESFEKLSQQIPDILSGRKSPGNALENLMFGALCARFHRDKNALAGVRWLQSAFSAEPSYPDAYFAFINRFDAVVCAVCAATGQSDDAAGLDEAARADLRKQALEWLRMEYRNLEKNLSAARMPRMLLFAHVQIRNWQLHPALAGVRDEAELLGMPTEERAQWLAFWDDVAALRKKLAD